MPILLTDELKALALEVADQYEPLEPPLLVGSCVWLGVGNDIDVVVRVKDPQEDRGGEPCCSEEYKASWPSMAYRHGVVNVIAVSDERIWAGWRYAAEIMPGVPKALLEDKGYRVIACEKLREIGEKQCLSD